MYNKYLKYKNKYLKLKLGGGVSNSLQELQTNGNDIIIDNSSNILSYIRYNDVHNLINIINIPQREVISTRKSLPLENIFILHDINKVYLKETQDATKSLLEITRNPPQSINYCLTYNNNNTIKIFTNNGNYQNINKFYIYVKSDTIISITLNVQNNTVNFDRQGDNIITYNITNITNIEVIQKEGEITTRTNINCNPFTFNFLNINIINIINIMNGGHNLNISELDTKINLFNLLNINFIGFFNESPFNYQESYDSFRNKNLVQMCPQSNILLKNIYNSIFNILFIKHNHFYQTHINHKNLIEVLIEIQIYNLMPNLNTICSEPSQRISLLQNMIKRLSTTYKNRVSLYNNKTCRFESINHINQTYGTNFKVILDSGNSTYTSIGKNIVETLGLDSTRVTNTYAQGVVSGASSKENVITSVQLQFNDESYSLDKNYTINGYVSNGLVNIILLGQSESNGLKQLFDDNYCISYDLDKPYNSIHTPTYIKETNELIDKIIKFIDSFNIVSNRSTLKRVDVSGKMTELDSLVDNFISKHFNYLNDERIPILYEKLRIIYDFIYSATNVSRSSVVDNIIDNINRLIN